MMYDFDKWWHDVVTEDQRYAGKRKDLARDAWDAGEARARRRYSGQDEENEGEQ